MGDEPTTGETRAERIKRKWDEGEPERAARRAEQEADRRAALETVGLIRRTGYRVAGLPVPLIALLILAVIALPAVVVWALVDSDAWAAVLGIEFAIGVTGVLVLLVIAFPGDW